jgi:hypothetical protein
MRTRGNAGRADEVVPVAVRAVVASDPFFKQPGTVIAGYQRVDVGHKSLHAHFCFFLVCNKNATSPANWQVSKPFYTMF